MQALLFLSLAILVFFILRMLLNLIIEARAKTNLNQSEPKLKSQNMVRCAHCGIHLPQSEAYYDGQHTYCSEGHLHQGPQEKTTSSNHDLTDND